ncbi:hypothetical protein DL96DRAFT_1467725 [Flagelloscypha sp. PMI_526]|nr:hypothetical protein DL96DRAFT_1467725 [Flagelloscypha sp. PMI_526]
MSQQAGPLPQKQGEIGYDETLHTRDDQRTSSSSPVNLPARHPADRDDPPSDSNTPSPDPQPTQEPVTTDSSSTTPSVKRRHFLKFLDSKKIPAYWGLRLTTLLAFFLQVLIVAGTVTGWALTAKRIAGGDGNDLPSQMMGSSSSIFVHVVFGIAILGQLIFLERRIFMLRAQRYSYVHPGQILPSARYTNMTGVDPVVAWSPWNRPPLPSYAAALAQSGAGTGDVEDHIIAQPPPPAYGNTRGSTMLLQGYLRESLRLQRPPSAHSQNSRMSLHSAPGDRPLSYRSTDSGWDVIQDADRALRLEQTLAALERPQPAASRQTTE